MASYEGPYCSLSHLSYYAGYFNEYHSQSASHESLVQTNQEALFLEYSCFIHPVPDDNDS